MLQIRKGAEGDRMAHGVWFALGVAYALHGMYMKPDMVITDHIFRQPDAPNRVRHGQIVKLRMKDLSDFDRSHWYAVVARQLEPMGYEVGIDLQHLVITWNPERQGKLCTTVE